MQVQWVELLLLLLRVISVPSAQEELEEGGRLCQAGHHLISNEMEQKVYITEVRATQNISLNGYFCIGILVGSVLIFNFTYYGLCPWKFLRYAKIMSKLYRFVNIFGLPCPPASSSYHDSLLCMNI